MNAATASQWLIDQRYLNCSQSEMGTWCKKSLPVARGKTEFLTGHICPDISCTLSNCMFSQNFESNIRYNKATTLLIFGLKGYSDFRFADNSQTCTVREGDVWLINTGGTEICRHTPAGIHAKMSVIKYSTERINSAFKASDDICMLISHNQMIRLGHQESPDQWISDLVNNPMLSATDRLLAEARALELIARWISPAQPETTVEEPSLQAVTDLLIRDLAHPPSLSELAREAGMSHARLNRQFKKHYGATVFDWLRSYRMQRACTYLRDPQRSITDIAFQCGFSSASHFAQSFKKQFGHSPSEYRDPEPNS
mgnify:CR=1 FL=1